MTDQPTAANEPTALVVPHQDLVTDESFEYDFLARDFDRIVARIASDLRDLAERVSRFTAPEANRKTPGFGVEAATLVSQIMNAMPNLGLDGLILAAEQADTTLMLHRLNRSVHENDVLRANPHLTVAPVDPSGDAPAECVIDVHAGLHPEAGDYGQVTAPQEDGYSVIWHGDVTA